MNGPQPADPFQHGLPVLDGIRVRLRALRAPAADAGADAGADGGSDLDAVWDIFSDAETLRYWSHEPLASRDQAAEYLAGIARGVAGGTLFQWAVADRETDAVLGTVTLSGWDRRHRRAEIGFLLGRAHWGRGLASDAVRAALAFAFAEMRLHRVEADVDPENGASLRLLARLGFREEGYLAERWFTFGAWRDSVMLGLLAPDARQRTAAGTENVSAGAASGSNERP